jgi:hypothetical protein
VYEHFSDACGDFRGACPHPNVTRPGLQRRVPQPQMRVRRIQMRVPQL